MVMRRSGLVATICLMVFASGALAQAGMRGRPGLGGRLADELRTQREPSGRAEGGARTMNQGNSPMGGAAQGLSAEERSQLRRDVRQAGRDIYSDKGPRGNRSRWNQ